MPNFKFEGRDQSGEAVSGERQADSAERLSELLNQEGIIPITISDLKIRNSFIQTIKLKLEGKKINAVDLAIFSRQMYTLTKSGVPISTGMKYLSKSSNSQRLSEALLGISQKLESGKSLARSMKEYPNIFSPLMISMIQIGQNTGQLDKAFLRLTQYLELEGSTLKRVKTALRYPILVMSAIVIGMVIINLFVVPAFSKVYAKSNIQLPLITRILISISDLFINYWYFATGIIIFLIIVIYRYLHTAKGKFKWHRFQLKMPVIGFLLHRLVLLRFSESFSIVVNAGIPINEGLSLVAQSLDNEYAKSEVLSMKESIQRGSSIYKAASHCHLFTGLDLQMLSLSEKTGELGAMLNEIALYYQREIEYDLKHLIDIIEPIMLSAIALMVLFLALAVYMPIWSMVKLVH